MEYFVITDDVGQITFVISTENDTHQSDCTETVQKTLFARSLRDSHSKFSTFLSKVSVITYFHDDSLSQKGKLSDSRPNRVGNPGLRSPGSPSLLHPLGARLTISFPSSQEWNQGSLTQRLNFWLSVVGFGAPFVYPRGLLSLFP